MRTSTSERIVVVGGGFAGLSIAARLAQSGLPVTLFEAGQIGLESSTRNQGWLHSGAYFAREDPRLAGMCYRSLQQVVSFCPHAIEPHNDGMLYLFSRMETQRSEWTSAWDTVGLPYEAVSHREILASIPGLSPERVQHGFRLPDRSFRPHVVLEALAGAARNAGAEIRTHTPVTSLLQDDHHVFGVVTGAGEQVQASRVVLATGALTGRYWSDVLTPLAGGQSGFTQVILKTHLVSVEPELSRTAFCIVDDEGFNHLPHERTSVIGNGHWPPVQDPEDRAVDPEAIRFLWSQVAFFFPDFDGEACLATQEWAGTTMQILHVDQVDPLRSMLPTVINHRLESPHYSNLWSVYPGRATLWPQLAEQFRETLLADLGTRAIQSTTPPWSADTTFTKAD